MNNDTIAAISTPSGIGAIGLLRISGKDSFKILNKIFRPSKPKDLLKVPSHTVHYGTIVNNDNTPIDEVLITLMRAPSTYTKEDTVEISCHGNAIILQKILETTIKNGARIAEPGEFTKRAFLNGRIDLSQAEAVADLINSQTEESAKLSMEHIKGYLSRYVNKLQDTIKEELTILEANIDFADEDIQSIDYKKLTEKLCIIKNLLNNLVNSYSQGKIVKNGITTAIIGKANVGKSSLFNILSDSPGRAIVTHIPGTTRDLIEECINIKGKIFRFTDTAGFKKPKGIIEKKSLDLTLKCINDSVCAVFMLDNSKPLSQKDLYLWRIVSNKPHIIVINKTDLKQKLNFAKLQRIFKNKNLTRISCVKNVGINELKNKLSKLSGEIIPQTSNSEIIITNIRHKNLLEKTKLCIEDAISAIKNNLSIEFIATDLRHALENLQEITGEKVTETILDDIFSRFCIGK